ncbi:MAG: UDP-3-O-(3-hydroxymyristoyl)glucosamine N-acyltransferase [Lentimicrobiaceae bacterium]|nr:UDP-3-O-(3-hydroxymyristoyl)glucosamine N-acyltransferase [Lentimicrobiaceae bacterium]
MVLDKPLKVIELSNIIGSHVEILGDENTVVTGLNEIHMVESGDITFVDHPKYYEKVLKSKADVVLIDIKPENTYGKVLLISDDPFRDYVKLVKRFRIFVPQDAFVHPDAQIGEGTMLQPGVFVGRNVTIGKNCVIHSNVSIYDHTTIGDNVVIQSNSVIGGEAFYFKRRETHWDKLESCGSTIIGNDVDIGALCTIDKGVSGATVIGDGCKLDNHIQIGHDTVIGKHVLIGAHSAIAGVVKIEDHVLLWGRVSVNKDLTIGKGATLLATSAVDKDVEEGKVLFGSPAIDARRAWREMASMRKMPEALEDIEMLKEKLK